MTTQVEDSFAGPDVWGHTAGPLPELPHPGIERVEEPHLSEGDQAFGFSPYDSTACYGRYVAHWVLKDSRLYLSELFGYFKLVEPGPLFADWVSDWLVVEYGKTVSENCYPLQPLRQHCRAYLFSVGCLVRTEDAPDIETADDLSAMSRLLFLRGLKNAAYRTGARANGGG